MLYPEEINSFVRKKFLFKIRVTDYNIRERHSTYSVSRISDDERILSAFLNSSDEIEVILL